MSAQDAIRLMEQAWASGDREQQAQLSQQAYQAAVAAGRADVAAAVVQSSENLWASQGERPQAAPVPETPGGSGPATSTEPAYNYETDPETLRMREQQRADERLLQQQREDEARLREAQEAQRQQAATATMRAVLESYNLMGLYNTVVNFIKQGYDAEAVSVLIRTTPEYKQRFPAMEELARKGRAISEGEYIEYEQTSANLERRYGLPAGMLMGNVTKLLTNEVSVAELNDRVLLASSAALQAPQDVRQQFQEYYGIDTGGLTAYFLDPAVSTPLLERQAATAVIGTEARRQEVGVDRATAEYLQSLGVTQEQARTGFGQVAGARALTQGRGDVATQEQLVKSTFAGDQEAQQAVERAAGARVGRFQGGGGFVQTQAGTTGLGSAATR